MEKKCRFSLVTFSLSCLIIGSIIPVVYSQPNDDEHLPVLNVEVPQIMRNN